MSKSARAIIQYLIIFAATALLIWFSLRSLTPPGNDPSADKWSFLVQTWQAAHKGWLIVMAVVALISHLVRAERWRILIKPSGHQTKLSYSFVSLMVGYLVNLVIPRGGEFSRCYNLYKLDRTPVETSFGTVVVERVVDVICLLILVLLSFLFESEKLFAFIQQLPIAADQSKLTLAVYFILFLLLTFAVFVWFYKRNPKFNSFIRRTWQGFREGLLSVFRLKNKSLFIFYSVLIWVLYFLMSYMVIMAFPETSHLGVTAVLSLFAIGSIAMAVPLPGGTGSYHVLVPQGLVFLYAIPMSNAVAFVFIFHGWQTAIMIAGGAISLLVTSVWVKRKGRD
ncbi:MAG TPA: lysylphosphatidylglycerol synthase transmembrane domain-containing protein [Chryseosolibacter sp.]|nr:lysylphosphatidylglycerol synthase transmembrane domain-containing protein [Chryseosolibacter sp.]